MARAIMVQGTASNVGKSVICAGLCRIFRQDGYSVAPFKSQNMALNSFITNEGLEMGRAQVVQAEAAGIEPCADMNPVLLKPSGDSRSQVVVLGRVAGELCARDYYERKRDFVPAIRAAYGRLAAKFDIIVLEGAGSPVEINLRENDIVNMFMARLASAPVLLAADIDRGGVFASLAGTMALFSEEERGFVKGLVINKFRGDKSLLDSGLRQIEGITGRPVLGVIPHFRLDIDDEDSQSERLENGASGVADSVSGVKIAVIRLPRMSNYTDFNALARTDGVSLLYCADVSELKDADLVIIPGTKNTIGDLRWMRANGIENAVKERARRGLPVIGICGGYQMLGGRVCDPCGAEGGGELDGMGLLPVNTVFGTDKRRTRVSGRLLSLDGVLSGLSGLAVEGYEAHLGATGPADGETPKPVAAVRDAVSGGKIVDGAQRGAVYGTYIHGFFDADGIAAALHRAKGLAYNPTAVGSAKRYKENQYDALANILRDSLNMNMVYSILNNPPAGSQRRQRVTLTETERERRTEARKARDGKSGAFPGNGNPRDAAASVPKPAPDSGTA